MMLLSSALNITIFLAIDSNNINGVKDTTLARFVGIVSRGVMYELNNKKITLMEIEPRIAVSCELKM